ncbi:MAG: Mrp/NBP35 family ATP-binding protein [Spirochaetaceae bacterium]|nr:Mrp/NBP35 family ATP-binding protein [Spirochaetaceae bacterium]MBO5236787.1 Mrp/NBP35 family ATP-binding protein [Spirochaetaceae bacterium]
MSQECSHDCSSCSQDCNSRDMHEKLHPKSSVKKVIGVVSGKGGVGKSLVTSMLAVSMCKKGYRTAILDADITGPSIPKAFGLGSERATGGDNELYPIVSNQGIQMMSINFLLENETDPVVWRGPVIAGAVKQFWSDVVWSDVDYMFVDMPPGTGDVPLTVFQSIAVDGIIVVATPQELVGMIVQKAVKMSSMMNIPILGLVENMSYIKCPDCDKQIKLFGESNIDNIAKEYGLQVLARMPIDPAIASACDSGTIETADTSSLNEAIICLEALVK